MRRIGALTVAMVMGLLPGIAHAAWTQAKTPHFTVYSEGRPEQIKRFATNLEKFDGLLRFITNMKDDAPPNPVQVYMLSDDREVKALARNPHVAGFYSASPRSGYAVLSREPKAWQFGIGPEEILFHEYAHHFMLHYFPAAYPAWYVEGFAEFFSVVSFDQDGQVEFGKVPLVRVPTLAMISIMPLKQLLTRTADWRDPQQADRFYGTAWLLTHYFHYTPNRRTEFDRYLRAMNKGEKDVDPDAFFAGGLKTLEKELRAYLNHRRIPVTRYTPDTLPDVSVAVSPLDPVRGALMDDELALTAGRGTDPATLVASVRKDTARYPASAHAATLLAQAEWLADNADAALAAADRAVAIDPTMAKAHSVRAEVLLARAHESDTPADWKAALSAIVKANRADVDDPVPLVQFYRYHQLKGGDMPQVGYDGLDKAFSLLPQNPDYRFMQAQALSAKGDKAMASTLLDPLAYSPHASSMRDAAVRMKADYDAGRTAAMPKDD